MLIFNWIDQNRSFQRCSSKPRTWQVLSNKLLVSRGRWYTTIALCQSQQQRTHACTHIHNHFTALWILSQTTWVSLYQKKHSPTHIHRGHQSSLICFLHLLRSMASSLFNLRAWQSLSTICLQDYFGLPLGLAPSTSYSTHFFIQSTSSFRSTC